MIDTVYVHLEFKSKSGGWSINLPYLCNKCGVCCTLDDFLVAGPINAKPEKYPEVCAKAKTLYEEVGKLWEKDEAKYDHYITHTPCPFLENKLCSIYEIRPDGCRQFPNTPFGMLTQNCEALNRFKKQQVALKKGRATKATYHFTGTGESIKPSKFTETQYQNCIAKLHQAGITEDELSLFHDLNKRNKP
jgi:Fe-S-cluster containining protein